jgi:hypothetical protein
MTATNEVAQRPTVCKRCGKRDVYWVATRGDAKSDAKPQWWLATMTETGDLSPHRWECGRVQDEQREKERVAAAQPADFKVGDRIVCGGETGTVERRWFAKETQEATWWDGRKYRSRIKWTAGELVLCIVWDNPNRLAKWQRGLNCRPLGETK